MVLIKNQKIEYALVYLLCAGQYDDVEIIVFNNSPTFNIMQVIRMVVHWVQQWVLLLPQDQRTFMDT
jgi:hypothetical protein